MTSKSEADVTLNTSQGLAAARYSSRPPKIHPRAAFVFCVCERTRSPTFFVRMVEWCRLIHACKKAGEVFQVELCGHFSPQRIQEFAVYHRETRTWWTWGVVISTVAPCLVVPTILDLAPLSPPSKRVSDNGVFFAREFIIWWVFSYLASYQASHFVPIFRLSQPQLLAISTIAATGTTACSYLAAILFSFPVPFTLVILAPLWGMQVFALVAITWGSRIRATPEARPQIVSLLKVWACQCCLGPIYPLFMLAMISLPEVAQLPFVCLLPGLRLLIRNWLSRALEHLRDEMSEVVILNADVFSALFMAYCMQTVPSLLAIGGFVAIDVCHILIAVHDVNRFLHTIDGIQKEIDAELGAFVKHSVRSMLLPSTGTHSTSVLAQSEKIMAQCMTPPTFRVRRRVQTAMSRQKHRLHSGWVPNKKSVANRLHMSKPTRLKKIFPLGPETADTIHVITEAKAKRSLPSLNRQVSSIMTTASLTPLEQRYIHTVGRLLFFTEFLILLNYVEVVIPAIYTASLLIMYNLPNKAYYGMLSDLDEQELIHMVFVVGGYCLFELTSLLVLMWAFNKRLRISAVAQLAFLLEKQWDGVQVKFGFWVLYISQTLLRHFGHDMSFQFKWLRQDVK